MMQFGRLLFVWTLICGCTEERTDVKPEASMDAASADATQDDRSAADALTADADPSDVGAGDSGTWPELDGEPTVVVFEGSDCSSPYSCRPPDGTPGYSPRVYNPATDSEWFPLVGTSPTPLFDGLGNVRGGIADARVRINLGMRKEMGGLYFVYAWNLKTTDGIAASGWVQEAALLHGPWLRENMATLLLPDPGQGEDETAWVLTGETSGFEDLTVTKGHSGGGRRATDYLARPGGVVNVIFNVPGFEMGGYSVDTVPIGTGFTRANGVFAQEIPLYELGGTTPVKTMRFVYGFIEDGESDRRYGWVALEALSM